MRLRTSMPEPVIGGSVRASRNGRRLGRDASARVGRLPTGAVCHLGARDGEDRRRQGTGSRAHRTRWDRGPLARLSPSTARVSSTPHSNPSRSARGGGAAPRDPPPIADLEREASALALDDKGGNKKEAARRLGRQPQSLVQKARQARSCRVRPQAKRGAGATKTTEKRILCFLCASAADVSAPLRPDGSVALWRQR